jgi:hypothetical protein
MIPHDRPIPPDQARRIGRTVGILFIITFVTSIPALLLYGPVLHDTGYIVGGGSDNQILLGAALELLLIVANIGTAIVLYPIAKRQSETAALGFVTARVVESVFIAIGILSVLTVVALRQDGTGSVAVGEALVALKDWTFLLGPGFVVGIGNGMLLGYLMYRSGLVPRRMAVLGLVGGPLVCASGIAVLFGALALGGAGQFALTIPEIAWEASLGLYLAIKGFRQAPILLAAADRSVAPQHPAMPAVATA